MLDGRPASAGSNRIVVVTTDPGFKRSVCSAFGRHGALVVDVVRTTLAASEGRLDVADARAVVIDLTDLQTEMPALGALSTQLTGGPPIIVVGQAFSEAVARRLLQLRVAD